jgi:hypothetical protein
LTNYIAYSESPKITEESFLRREFGINTIYIKSVEDFLKLSKKADAELIIVVSTNPIFWLSILSTFKKNSIIFILIGNETYDPKVFNSLNDLKSLRHAFVYNVPKSIKTKNILGSIIGNIYDGGLTKTIFPGSVYRDARISYSLKHKFKKIKINYSCSVFPQGYSNNFANKISNIINITQSESLLSSKLSDLISTKRENIYDFTFIGQPTNRRREIFLKNIKDLPRTRVLYNEGFKGIYEDNDLTYLNQLLTSKFILVPPGFYNNSNHRYTESLIFHALPVILSNNSLDPSTNDNWTNQLSFIMRYSVKAQVNYLSNIDVCKYKEFYEQAKSVDFGQILDTKRHFSEVIR